MIFFSSREIPVAESRVNEAFRSREKLGEITRRFASICSRWNKRKSDQMYRRPSFPLLSLLLSLFRSSPCTSSTCACSTNNIINSRFSYMYVAFAPSARCSFHFSRPLFWRRENIVWLFPFDMHGRVHNPHPFFVVPRWTTCSSYD